MLPAHKAKGFNVVVAFDPKRGIGHAGGLPWKLSGDTRFFRELTTCPDRSAVEQRYGLVPEARTDAPASALDDFIARLKAFPALPMPDPDHRNAVVMGRHTWEGLPPAYRPLPNRLNGVLSRQDKQDHSGTHQVWGDLQQAIQTLEGDETVSEIFVIGGAQIYAEALQSSSCARIYATEIESAYPCDVFFPAIPPAFQETAIAPPVEENGIRYRFRLLQRAAM
jgi:dihydrofolate reductase